MKLVVLCVCFLTKSNFGVCYSLNIIHFNDFHARYEPVNNMSTTCIHSACIGGFSRLYSAIQLLLKNSSNSLLLNSGDNFQGTLWYLIYKWNVTQHFLNKLPLDAMTLGNHEFDDGIDGLIPFLENIRAPVVVSNIDDTDVPQLQNLFNRSVIIEKNGLKIGIIGVLTATTALFSKTESLKFFNEISSVNLEAERLSRQGIFTNIVLSHCGYGADIEMAKKSTSKIRVIVGGHTDTFLYTGTPSPGPDKPSGPYPTVVLNMYKERVLVVQASAYSKYLGNLVAHFNKFGNITSWKGNSIFLSPEKPTDINIDKQLEIWKEKVDLVGNKVVGSADVSMPHQNCRSEECCLGNFATDAMLAKYASRASAAIIHSGGMRAGISEGNITIKQLLTTFPFQDYINLCIIKGQHIKDVFESIVDNKHLENLHLFQISGMQIGFNLSQTEGDRVQTLRIRCISCHKNELVDVDFEQNYWILMPTFLSDTDFNPLLKMSIQVKSIGERDSDVYTEYLTQQSPLFYKREGRIYVMQ